MIRVYESDEITQKYVEFRPKFHDFVAEAVMKFHNENKSTDKALQVMVDVGCGSGQATKPFHKWFSSIIGVDVSPNQINQARIINTHDHIKYEVGTAEDIPVKSDSVDLLVSAVACNRFDLPKFFKEAKRVLKTDGSLALLGYNSPTIIPLGVDDEAFAKQLSAKPTKLLNDYEQVCNDPNSNSHWNAKFKNIYDSLPAKKKVWVTEGLLMEYHWNLNEFLGYFRSLAAYHEYMDAMKKVVNGQDLEKCDRANFLRSFIKREWGMENMADEFVQMKVQFDVYAVLATDLE